MVKPTKKDMIEMINHTAHEAGSIMAIYHDDRSPDRAGELEKRLTALQRKALEMASHFPPPKTKKQSQARKNGAEC